MSMNHKPCLVLNVDYTPISIVDWKTAINWSFKVNNQKKPIVDIVQIYAKDKILGCGKSYDIPCIIKINRFIKGYSGSVKFTRKNLFLRDSYTCQYCGKKYNSNKLTYDHVIPKSKWKHHSSPTCWNNIVTACSICNRKKADKTPAQANMKLLLEPIQPKFSFKYLPWYEVLTNIEYIPEWTLFIPKELRYESKYIGVFN